MKTIAVIGALEEQINSIKSYMEIISAKNIVGLDFIMGKMCGNNVVLVRSGIGKVNAAVCTQILIDMYAVDYVINVGIAGILNNELSMGDIVISDDICYHDFDTTCLGTSKGEIYRMDESFFKADPELIGFSLKAIEENGKNINIGRIATGDKLIIDDEAKNQIKNDFKPLCIDMESGAIAHTCELNRIPFIILCLLFEKISTNIEEIFDNTEIDSFAKIVCDIINMID